MDYRLAMMCGTDLPVPECQLIVHQPRIKEIALLGEQDFFIGAQCLTINKSMFAETEDKDALKTINNFQIFMTVMNEKDASDKRKATIEVLQLLLPSYKTMFTPRSLIFVKDGNNITIDESNFEFLQEILKMIFCSRGAQGQQTFNPADEEARKIAEKIMRGRAKIAAEKGEAQASIFSQYLSILTIGLHIPLQELMNLTMFQLYDLVERFNLYVAWDIDIRSRLAGGKPDKHPDNWMKNIH